MGPLVPGFLTCRISMSSNENPNRGRTTRLRDRSGHSGCRRQALIPWPTGPSAQAVVTASRSDILWQKSPVIAPGEIDSGHQCHCPCRLAASRRATTGYGSPLCNLVRLTLGRSMKPISDSGHDEPSLMIEDDDIQIVTDIAKQLATKLTGHRPGHDEPSL
jgi:hypothetical protein